MGQIARSVPAFSVNGITRPALALDDNGSIILIGEAVDFVALYGLKLLYLGLPESTPVPPVMPFAGTVFTPPTGTATPPAGTTPAPPSGPSPFFPGMGVPSPPPPTFPFVPGSGGATAPMTTDGDPRPGFQFDSAGNPTPGAGSGNFFTVDDAKLGKLGSPAPTPAPVPPAATPPGTPIDSNASVNAVAEGAAAGSETGVTANAASPTGQTITYTLTDDSSAGGFKVDATTGVVTVADPTKIDFESAATGAYQITVRASDGRLASSQTFTIAVTNVAPATPTDANAAANAVAEGAAVGTIVGITAASSDINGPAVTYTLTSDSSNGGFAVDPTTGVVTVADSTKLDCETSGAGKSYSVTVTASDGSQTASQTFSIAVTDVPLATPTDVDASANQIAEGAAAGTGTGLKAQALDPNGPATSYALLSDSSNGGFAIDAVTGVVTVADPSKIDYESVASRSYAVVVQATSAAATTTQSFTIAVNNVAPSAPADSNAAANTVAEGAANGTTVGITASSTDVNGPAVTYSLTGDTSGGGFTIDATTGVVTVADSTRIDFESSGGSYTITTQASDGTLTSTQTFTIAVADVAPSTPVDINAAANIIAEGAAAGSTVGITASSSDINGPGVTYSLTGDTSNGGFAIDAATGVVTVADASKIDFETSAGHAYTITAQASDGTLATSQTFTIAVTNVAPSTPVDSNAGTNTVAEGAANGSTVGLTVSSTDLSGPGVTYALVGDTSLGGFAIDATTGVVTVADSTRIDFETSGGSYSIIAQASDGALTSSQTFTVAVTNVAPSTPVDSNAASNAVVEGAANGTAVGITASSTDVNGPNVSYSLTGDTSNGGFAIDAATGVVTVANASKIDFETSGGSYTITTQASDGTLASSQIFTIAVTDVAPTTPVDSNAAANTVSEGPANGSTVGITASSSDINGPGVTYSLTGDTSNGGFAIDATTGVVTVANSSRIDFETSGGSYTITTRASDGTLTSSQTFTIAVTNFAPTTPVDSNAGTNTVVEAAANGSTVGLTVSSTDVGGPGVTYSLTGDTSNGGFAIDATTGVVTVANSSRIDFESSGGSYTVTAQASDGVLTSSQTFTIAVSNVPPGVPTDANGSANKVFSGAAAGNGTGVTASSSDPSGGTVTYALLDDSGAVANAGNRFTIDAATGVVTVSGVTPIVYDSVVPANNDYAVTVCASDPSGAFTSQSFTISVDPNAPPAINSNGGGASAATSVAENTTAVTVVQATDADNGPSPISYSIVGGDDASKFAIVATGAGAGTLTFITPPDFETPTDSATSGNNTYIVTVRASDGAAFTDQTITVTVTDVNDAPVITSNGAGATASVSANENQTTVTTVTASDQDVPAQQLTFSLVGGADRARFAIDPSTGVLTFVTAPNFEAPTDSNADNAYDVIVRVTDDGAPNLNNDQAIRVNVQNVNEAPQTNAVTTSGNEDANAIAITITATDPDAGDSISAFQITGIPGGAQFYSDAGLTSAVSSGSIVSAAGNAATLYYVPAANFNGQVQFQAAAIDSNGLTDASPATETINVTAVNDAPVNNNVPAGFAVESGSSYAITGLSITDVDANEQGVVNDITTTLSAAAGTVTIGAVGGGATITGNGSGTVTLTGSIAQINTSLAGSVSYAAPSGAGNSTTTLSIATNDKGHTGSGGGAIDTDVIQIVVTPQVWFINSDQSSANSGAARGSQSNPFASISEFNAAPGPGVNDYIYLKAGTYSGDGINLKDGQTLLGDDQELSFANPQGGAPIVIDSSSGARPTINVTTNGDQGIDLASNNTVRGINITTGTGTTGLDDNGNAVGTFSAGSINIAGTGQAVKIFNGGNLAVALDTVSSSGGTYGIQLGGALTGSFAGATGSLSGHSNTEFYVTGGAGTISYGGNIGDGSGFSTQLFARNGGSVTLSGNINDGADVGGGINIANNTAGTITLSGAAKVVNTGGGSGVSLSNNTGSTVTFTNGGLSVDTTSGGGFIAAGGGIVNVTGANNHIASTTGTALSVQNTTIGASGLTFKDISANGAASGIVLNNTGTSGGLTVTGDGGGSNNGSGGTIRNSTGDGISLTTTQDVKLGYMNITNNLGDGIGGSGINGFVLNRLNISGNGNDAGTDESGINLSQVTGTASSGAHATSISNTVISNNNEFELKIANSSGTLTNFQLINNTISSNGQPINGNANSPHGDLVQFLGSGTSVVGVTVNGGSFTGNKVAGGGGQTPTGSGFFANSGGTSMTANIFGATFTNNGAAGVNVATDNAATSLTFDIENNSFVGNSSTAINHFDNGNAPFNRTVNGTIKNNVIGTQGVALSGSSVGSGITIQNEGAVNAKFLIIGNTIQEIGTGGGGGGGPGINVNVGLGGSATGGGETDITILNNIIRNIESSRAIVISENQITNINNPPGAGPFPTVFANIAGNSFANIAGQAGNGQFIRIEQSYGTFKLTQAAPTSGANANELDDANGFNDPTKISRPSTYIYNAGTPPLPSTNTLPQLAASGALAGASDGSGARHLTQTELDTVVAAAIAQWGAAGASASQLATLTAAVVKIADLTGNIVGQENSGYIQIDVDAAGHGWFIDPTPADNAEFTRVGNAAGTDLFADPGSDAAGRIDLLTTVAHELGHAIGLPDLPVSGETELMTVALADGERRLPTGVEVARAIEAVLPVSAQAAAGTPIIAGTPGNDVITAGVVDREHGGKILFGGAGADTFVFGSDVQLGSGAQLTHVADYHAAQGDRFDFTGLAAAIPDHDGNDAMSVRAVADSSGSFSTLQVNMHGGPDSYASWVSVAQLDGIHAGDEVAILIGPAASAHLLQIHVDLIA